MQIHQVKAKKSKSRKRIARGGKRGTYSGKGMKGQKSRSGASIDPLFEGGRSSLIDRLKKLRGFKSVHPKKAVLNLDDIENSFKVTETVSVEALVEKGLVSRKKSSFGIKILSRGKITKKLTFEKDILFSASAKSAIIKSGGEIKK